MNVLKLVKATPSSLKVICPPSSVSLSFNLGIINIYKFFCCVKQALGKYGIICIEDIVHEIATVGSHFKEVTKFLWPFRLKAPERRLLLKKKPYKDGGDSGNREEHINELIDKLN